MIGTMKHMGGPERKLIDLAVSGDCVALEQLLLDCYDRLLRHLAPKIPAKYRSVLSPDDVIQETYIHVFTSIGDFRPESDSSFYAWLVTIADNRFKDAFKALNRKKRGGDFQKVARRVEAQRSAVVDLVEMLSTGGASPSRVLSRREAECAVMVAIAELPGDYRRVVRLRYLEGREMAEIAQMVGKSAGAVRGILRRARERMRESLGRSSLYLTRF